MGAYLFFRRAMSAGWIAAAFGAWWYPLGTLVLYSGYPGAATVSFLPWMLLTADARLTAYSELVRYIEAR